MFIMGSQLEIIQMNLFSLSFTEFVRHLSFYAISS